MAMRLMGGLRVPPLALRDKLIAALILFIWLPFSLFHQGNFNNLMKA
jgi:hypothetical protein